LIIFSKQGYTENLKPVSIINVPGGLTLTKKTGLNRDIEDLRLKIRDGEQYKCFTSFQWKTMANIIIDYRWFWDYTLTLEKHNSLKEQEIENIKKQVLIYTETVRLLEDNRKITAQLFKLENDYKKEILKRGKIRQYLLIGVVVLETVILSTVGLTIVIKK